MEEVETVAADPAAAGANGGAELQGPRRSTRDGGRWEEEGQVSLAPGQRRQGRAEAEGQRRR